MDEREGIWTIVREEADRVTIWESKTHWRGRVFGAVMAIAVTCSVNWPVLKPNMVLIVSATAILIVTILLWKLFRGVQSNTGGPLLAIIDGSPKGPDTAENTLWSESIHAVILRKNSGCTASDESMWQVYVRVENETTARLVYQQSWWGSGYDRALSLANRLSSRWGVELIQLHMPDKRRYVQFEWPFLSRIEN